MLDAFNPQHEAYKALKAELAVAQMNKSAKGRADTIIANMERWRWMPHDTRRDLCDGQHPRLHAEGRAERQDGVDDQDRRRQARQHATPLLTETMKYITVNPTWNVPPSIIRNEYLPALAQRPGRAGADRTADRPQRGRLDPHLPAAGRAQCARPHPVQFPQSLPGVSARHAGQEAVRQATRAYSHGCMRVQNPDEYAEVLLGVSQPDRMTPPTRIRSMYGSSERSITFKHADPGLHHLPDRVRRRRRQAADPADIYGLDRRLLNILHGDRRDRGRADRAQLQLDSKPVIGGSQAACRGAPRRAAGRRNTGTSGDEICGSSRTAANGRPVQLARSPYDRSGAWTSPGWRGRPARWRRSRSRTARAAAHTCAACRRCCRRR